MPLLTVAVLVQLSSALAAGMGSVYLLAFHLFMLMVNGYTFVCLVVAYFAVMLAMRCAYPTCGGVGGAGGRSSFCSDRGNNVRQTTSILQRTDDTVFRCTVWSWAFIETAMFPFQP